MDLKTYLRIFFTIGLAAQILQFPIIEAEGQDSIRALPQLRIVAEPASPATRSESLNHPDSLSLSELAPFLGSIPGVSGSRIGGHGIDPVIRGQGQGRINVIRDGAFIHGGCPNRMDPASSYIMPGMFDSVTVTKGVESLRYGAGGSGGTVQVNRLRPSLSGMGDIKGRANAAFESNGDRRLIGSDLAAGIGGPAYLRIGEALSDGNDYSDGSGAKVRSGFKQNVMAAELGTAAINGFSSALTYDLSDGDDLLYGGSEMDAPDSDSYGTGLKFQIENPSNEAVVDGQLYFSRVDHLMDNYTLRPLAAGRMPMFADSRSDVAGGRLGVEGYLGAVMSRFGVDLRAANQRAERFAVAEDSSKLQSVLWPNVSQTAIGSYGEAEWKQSPQNSLALGVRYDRVLSDAEWTERKPMGQQLSAAELYSLYYGDRSGGDSDDNLSALAAIKHRLADSLILQLSLSRSVRSPDITERYIASNGKQPQDRWIGNPSLEPEIHHAVSPSVTWNTASASSSAGLFYDWAADFVTRDRARAQSGIRQSDLASIYRNVDAQLFGGEVETEVVFDPMTTVRAWAAYVQGTNEDDNRALAQIPPLNGGLLVSFSQEKWTVEPSLKFSMTQHRADTDKESGSGLDTGETAGVVTADLRLSYLLFPGTTVDLICSNILDKNYANHLNRGSVFDVETSAVNEPGRSLLAQIRFEN